MKEGIIMKEYHTEIIHIDALAEHLNENEWAKGAWEVETIFLCKGVMVCVVLVRVKHGDRRSKEG